MKEYNRYCDADVRRKVNPFWSTREDIDSMMAREGGGGDTPSQCLVVAALCRGDVLLT